MDDFVQTLFSPIIRGGVDVSGWRAAFLGAQPGEALSQISGQYQALLLQQGFKPYADALEKEGFRVDAAISEAFEQKKIDAVFLLLPKNVVESRFLFACGLSLLRPGGMIFAAAGNKAGGGRIQSMFRDFGIENFMSDSLNKARVVWTTCSGYDVHVCERTLQEGGRQNVLDGAFVSQPGVYGWDKVDAGSKLFMDVLPEDLKGWGADFGCGYGYLSHRVLSSCSGVKKWTALDADYRAVSLCEENLKPFSLDKTFVWADLIQKQDFLQGKLDFIVMNPPFHEGKKIDYSVGQAFIQQARACLRKKGVLWMVANVHLPYETLLGDLFADVEFVTVKNGFKVLSARC